MRKSATLARLAVLLQEVEAGAGRKRQSAKFEQTRATDSNGKIESDSLFVEFQKREENEESQFNSGLFNHLTTNHYINNINNNINNNNNIHNNIHNNINIKNLEINESNNFFINLDNNNIKRAKSENKNNNKKNNFNFSIEIPEHIKNINKIYKTKSFKRMSNKNYKNIEFIRILENKYEFEI